MALVKLSTAELIAVRARALLLADVRATSAVEAVATVGALQAQSTPAVHQALRARTSGLQQTQVLSAIVDEHSLVRTTLMRGTLFLVPAGDVRWMVDLVGPVVRAKDQRRRLQLGISDLEGERALAVLPSVLKGRGAVSLSSIVAALGDFVDVDLTGQAPAHLMLLAATHALVCRGPEAGREPTYALLDEWAPAGAYVDPETALVRLAGIYLSARGPATARDFATWSGLPAAQCRSAFAQLEDVVLVQADGVECWALASADLSPPSRMPVRLVGMFDEYLLSHRGRDPMLDADDAPRILTGGVIQSAVLVDGRIAGTWRVRPNRRRIDVTLFRPQPAAVRQEIDVEVEDILRFLST